MAKKEEKGTDKQTEEEVKSLFEKLSQPFAPDCVEWIILNAVDIKDNNGYWIWAIASPYIRKESAEDRADQVFGPENWENEFTFPDENGRFTYTIKFRTSTDGPWHYKRDVGSLEPDKTGGFKGSNFETALAYAEKRVWQKLGIGRYLKLVKPIKVNTQDGFQVGWEKYSFKSKWQKDGKGREKRISFYWETPSLPNKALPEEFQNTQSPDNPGGTTRQQIEMATDDQWEEVEAYIQQTDDEVSSLIKDTVYNEIVDDEGADPTGEVTYERKRLSKENLDKVLVKLRKKYGKLPLKKEKKKQKPEPEKGEPEEQPAEDKKKSDGDGKQDSLFPDGKDIAKSAYGDPE